LLSEKSLSKVILFHLIAILLVISNILDIKIAGFSRVVPLFDVMMVFYFSVFINIFSIGFIFILGFFNDAINGNPLGMTSLIYIILIKIFTTLNNRMLVKQDFRYLFKQFVIFLACFLFLKFIFLSLFNSAVYSISNIIIQLILTSIFYVLMHKFFDYLNKKFIQD